jgi:hypothetical protein
VYFWFFLEGALVVGYQVNLANIGLAFARPISRRFELFTPVGAPVLAR